MEGLRDSDSTLRSVLERCVALACGHDGPKRDDPTVALSQQQVAARAIRGLLSRGPARREASGEPSGSKVAARGVALSGAGKETHMERLKLEPVKPVRTERVRGSAQKYEKGRGRYHEVIELEVEVWPDDTKALGGKLRELRKRFGMFLGDAARALELDSVSTLSAMERGAYRFDLEEVERRFRTCAPSCARSSGCWSAGGRGDD